MRRSLVVAALAASLVAGATAPAQAAPRILVVATDGSDTASGTVREPLATVDAAVRRLPVGGTVLLRGGTYHQRVHLDGVRGITVRPRGHEHATLSGSGIAPPDGLTALVEITDAERVTVRDLELTGYRTARLDATPAGVVVRGHGDRVRLIGLHVHHLGNDNRTVGSFDINAHGIAVYGDDPSASIRRLEIRGNRVDHLRLGASEAVVVNGNVEHWSIVRNRVESNDNIGIDAIGFEETLAGRDRYTDRNRARDGMIAFNTVRDIASRGNPAYREEGGWCDCADGIYVDGGTRIRIHDNVVDRDDIGIEVAAENARGDASHVRVENNRITRSLLTGLATGGYCDGGEDCGGERTGTSHDNVFAGNVLAANNRKDDGSPEVLVQYGSSRNRFTGNRITAANADHVLFGTVPRATGRGDVRNRNVYRAEGGSARTAVLGWYGRTYTGFARYPRKTGQDRRSVFR